MIHNPIIPGFAPDPSIIRVDEDYYIAVSSFEWFPGVPIYHSRDLRSWRLCDYGLKEPAKCNLIGLKPSAGVWAPCLSYDRAEKTFYLLYSIVHSKNNWYFDVDNYLITSDSIHGPWSDPVYLCSSGFDYSLFHDDDGRKWIVGKDRDFRTKNIDQRPIILQEYDAKEKRLLGKPVPISRGGTSRRFVEAPHLYKHDGKYYLMVAEGGTGYGHSVVVLRSDRIEGPYECYEGNPVITSAPEAFEASEHDSFLMPGKYNPDADLQKAGHGSLVETADGEWYVAHLCARPLLPSLRCILGRETAIQKMTWTEDGRLLMEDGSNLAKAIVPAPDLLPQPRREQPVRTFFGADPDPHIPPEFQSPRLPFTEDWISVCKEKGFLSIRGRESLTSNYYPSIAARTLTAFQARIETCLHYDPDDYHQRAGLCVYYDLADHYCIFKTWDEELGKAVLSVEGVIGKQVTDGTEQLPVERDQPVWLRGVIDHTQLQFWFSTDGQHYRKIGQAFETLNLSDEGGRYGRFTGTYVGMFAMDCLTKSKWARFAWFDYETGTGDGSLSQI